MWDLDCVWPLLFQTLLPLKSEVQRLPVLLQPGRGQTDPWATWATSLCLATVLQNQWPLQCGKSERGAPFQIPEETGNSSAQTTNYKGGENAVFTHLSNFSKG